MLTYASLEIRILTYANLASVKPIWNPECSKEKGLTLENAPFLQSTPENAIFSREYNILQSTLENTHILWRSLKNFAFLWRIPTFSREYLILQRSLENFAFLWRTHKNVGNSGHVIWGAYLIHFLPLIWLHLGGINTQSIHMVCT